MRDAYKVLGVSRSDSMETIKKTYRDLAKKYHPDSYVGHDLADLAEEKMKEINEAYDIIVREREVGAPPPGRAPGGNGAGGVYGHIRSLIGNGQLDEAEQLLHDLASYDAEWHFLMGGIHFRRGWLDDARRAYETACRMDPGNHEYRTALNFMMRSGQRTSSSGPNGISSCDCCSTLFCANCCCRMSGQSCFLCC